MKLAVLPLLLAPVFTAACSSSSQFVRGDPAVQMRLRADQSIYIALPEDGRFEDKVYAGSGKCTAEAIFDAFLRRTQKVRLGRDVEDREAAIESAARVSGQFVALATILHWEDRATEWSGLLDKVRVRIEILDAETGERVDSAVLEGKSAWATLGGDHPQDLLAEPVSAFIASLYGVIEPGKMDGPPQDDRDTSDG